MPAKRPAAHTTQQQLDKKDADFLGLVPGGTRTRNLCLRRAAPYPLGHRDVTTDTARKKCCREVLPGLEPGLQGSEPWVLTNYTIEPSSLRRTQGDGPRNCDGSLERKTTKVEEGMQYPTHKRIAACSALHTSALGWCSWLSRVPHTHKVTSSILVPSTFFFLAVLPMSASSKKVQMCKTIMCWCGRGRRTIVSTSKSSVRVEGCGAHFWGGTVTG